MTFCWSGKYKEQCVTLNKYMFVCLPVPTRRQTATMEHKNLFAFLLGFVRANTWGKEQESVRVSGTRTAGPEAPSTGNVSSGNPALNLTWWQRASDIKVECKHPLGAWGGVNQRDKRTDGSTIHELFIAIQLILGPTATAVWSCIRSAPCPSLTYFWALLSLWRRECVLLPPSLRSVKCPCVRRPAVNSSVTSLTRCGTDVMDLGPCTLISPFGMIRILFDRARVLLFLVHFRDSSTAPLTGLAGTLQHFHPHMSGDRSVFMENDRRLLPTWRESRHGNVAATWLSVLTPHIFLMHTTCTGRQWMHLLTLEVLGCCGWSSSS